MLTPSLDPSPEGRGKHVHPRKTLYPYEEFLRIHKQFMRFQQRSLRIAAQQVIARGRISGETGDGFIDFMMQTERSIRWKIIEQHSGALEKQRQVIFDSCGRDALAYILVDAGFGRITLEAFAEALAKVISGTGYRVRCVSTSKVAMVSISSSNRSIR